MNKFWLGLAASCLVLLAVDSAMAGHHSRRSCRVYSGTPYAGRIQVYSSGGIYRSYGGYGGYNNFNRPYGGYYNQGFYGNPGFGTGYRGYGRSGFGIYIGF